MKKITLLLVLVIIVMSFMLAGCSANPPVSEDKSDESASETSEDKITVGISFGSEQDANFVRFKNVLYQKAEELGYEVLYTNADGDITKQASDVKDLISQSPDAIIILPQDSLAIASSVKDCKEAGIPVIVSFRPIAEDAEHKPNVNVVADAYGQGYESMKATLNKMIEDGIEGSDIKTMIISGDAKDENSVLRVKGAKDALAEVGGKILLDIPTDWDPEKAKSGVSAAIQAYPEANAMFYAADVILDGGVAAMQAANVWKPYGEEGFKYYIATCDANNYVVNDYIPNGYVVSDTLFNVAGQATDSMIYVKKIVEDGEEYDYEVAPSDAPCYTIDNWDDEEMQALMIASHGEE